MSVPTLSSFPYLSFAKWLLRVGEGAQFVERLKRQRGCERLGVAAGAQVSVMAVQGRSLILIGLLNDSLGSGPSHVPANIRPVKKAQNR